MPVSRRRPPARIADGSDENDVESRLRFTDYEMRRVCGEKSAGVFELAFFFFVFFILFLVDGSVSRRADPAVLCRVTTAGGGRASRPVRRNANGFCPVVQIA